MVKKIKELFLSLAAFSMLAVPILAPVTVYAADDTIINSVCNGSNFNTVDGNGISDCNEGGGGGGIDTLLTKIIQIFSIIVGFVAVVMIIIGGIKYITSGGDSGNISGAKNTIIYAVIGLIVVALAQVLVHFVLKNVSSAANAG